MIAALKEMNHQERTQKKRLLWFIGIFVSVVAFALITVLILDLANGHLGYFRY